MTLKSFKYWFSKSLKLPELEKIYVINNIFRYKLNNNYFCPITLVYYVKTGRYYETSCAIIAAEGLGMTRELSDLIPCASDNFFSIKSVDVTQIERMISYFRKMSQNRWSI
ncbi:MAG: hypothetical protein AABY22_26215 [Nanoarchaeota archaeon]